MLNNRDKEVFRMDSLNLVQKGLLANFKDSAVSVANIENVRLTIPIEEFNSRFKDELKSGEN